jgi:hypothetical protein
MDTHRKHKKIGKLMKIDPHCYYCGIGLIWYKTTGNEKLPHNFATIEHLYDKYEPEKRREFHKKCQSQTVISCFRCNQKRGEERTKMIPIEQRKVREKILQERKRLGLTTPRDIFLKQTKIDDLLPSANSIH